MFLGGIVTIVVIVGTLMYVIEGEEHGFTSIPTSMYWAVVTMTTVGYGDIAPRTPLGQLLASLLMILGYGIIAVPTGIVSVELAHAGRAVSRQACPSCGAEGHDVDADPLQVLRRAPLRIFWRRARDSNRLQDEGPGDQTGPLTTLGEGAASTSGSRAPSRSRTACGRRPGCRAPA